MVAAYLAAAVLVIAPGSQASANELDALYRQVIRHPGNPELNLRFAQLAESSGHLRWALSAYERVVINDPNNAEGQRGLQRIRRKLQPNTTLVTVQLGTQFESNPRNYLPPRRGEMQGLASVGLYDERGVNGIRWRTNAIAAGLFHQRESQLNYGVAGIETGPVLDFFPGWSVHPAIGGNATYYNNRFYYAEGSASATFESGQDGIYRAIQVRGAYRSFDDFFPSSEGFIVEVRGRLAVPNALSSGVGVIVSPWVIRSDIGGSAAVVNPISTELQPGAYLEWGSRFDFVRSIAEGAVAGLHVSARERDYRNDIVAATGEKRRDRTLIPGASITFPNLFAAQTGLRLEYQYIWNNSNDQTKKFNDHIVGASLIAKFNPALFGRPQEAAAPR